jgi:hypothetical protein
MENQLLMGLIRALLIREGLLLPMVAYLQLREMKPHLGLKFGHLPS